VSRRPSPEFLGVLAIVLGVAHLAVVAFVAAARLGHPFELDWLEGAVLEQVFRVRAGQPLYVAPTLDYVPLNYPPLFYWASAAASWLVGPSFAAMRLVSVLSAACVLVLAGWLVARETGRRAAGWLTAGLIAAGHHLAEGWLDIGRGDSLHLALLLGGVCAYRFGAPHLGPAVLAGVLWGLAFLTKQSTPVALVFVFAWILFREFRRGLTAIVVFAVFASVAWLALDAAHGGWFRYYAFDVPRKFPLDPALAARFMVEMSRLAPAALLGLFGAWSHSRSHARDLGFLAALVTGFVVSGWHLRTYAGAGENVLLISILGVAIGGGLGWAWLTSAESFARWRLGATVLLCIQFGVLFRNPLPEFPTAADRAAGENLVRRIAQPEGRVYVSSHPFLLRRAGKPTNAHIAPLMDVVRMRHAPFETELWQTVKDSLQAHAWSVLVLDGRDWLLEEAEEAGYRRVARVFDREDVFWPVTGYRTRPEWVLAPPERIEAAR
jgi:hypothetical protein